MIVYTSREKVIGGLQIASRAQIYLFVLVNFLISTRGYLQAQNNPSPQRALIIALSDYNEATTGWNPIHADNDANILRKTLELIGFRPDRISLITNEHGTKSAIEKRVEQFIQTVRPGEFVYMHISAHGQQLRDDDGDEADGYDEAMVPLDAPRDRFKVPGYRGENHIRDDAIRLWIQAIRERAGNQGRVLFVGDFCHSGSATRGIQPIRGTPLTLEGKRVAYSGEKTMESFESQRNLADLFCMFAASPNESNAEINVGNTYYGSLTYSVCKTLAEGLSAQYAENLWYRVRQLMNTYVPNQMPQQEGELKMPVLSNYRPRDNSYAIIPGSSTTGTVVIPAGMVHGATLGAEVTIFPIKESDKTFTGWVTNSQYFESTVSFQEKLPNGVEHSHRAMISRALPRNRTFRIALEQKQSDPNVRLTVQSLVENPLFELVGMDQGPDVVISREVAHGRSYTTLYTFDNEEIIRIPSENLNTEELLAAIRRFAAAQHLKCWYREERDIDLTIWLVDKKTNVVLISNSKNFAVSGNHSIIEGTEIIIRIRNNGKYKTFFALVDIQPDGIMNCLAPSTLIDRASFECVLDPGETIELSGPGKPKFKVQKPYGREVLKLIAGFQPVEICPVIESLGTSRSASLAENSDLMSEIADYFGSHVITRGAQTSSKRSYHVESLLFDIIPLSK